MEQIDKRIIKRSILIFTFMVILVNPDKSALSQIVDDFQVTAITEDTDKFLSSIAVDDSGNFIIAWVDMRGSGTAFSVLAKRFMNDGTALDSSFIVCEEDTNNFFFTRSSIAVDAEGNFVIIWHAFRDFIYNLYAQRFQKNGERIGENIVVNDSIRADAETSSIAMNRSGDFIVVWEDRRNKGTADIYAQRYSSDGTPLGSNFRIDFAPNNQPASPSVSMNNNGRFIVVWSDEKDTSIGIYAQRFDSEGTSLGDIFLVDDDLEGLSSRPKIASDSLGNFIITWNYDEPDGSIDIYGRRYLANGSALGGSFKVNDDSESVWHLIPIISVREDGNFIISWEDYRNVEHSPDIYAQCYSSDGIPLGNNFCVTDLRDLSQNVPTVKLYKNRIYNTWSDDHIIGTGLNVWCNILDWEETIISRVEPEPFQLLQRFSLQQNYPNPFNPVTIINYELPITNDVELEIYNMLGEKVVTLVSGRQEAGLHQVEWDASGFASGVYYYRIETGEFVDVKKMILLR
jgi:hypothetical protein